MKKNIIIMSDLLMTKETEQDNNTRWLYDLLSNVLGSAISCNVVRNIANDNDAMFSRSKFFHLSGINLFENEMQFYFSEDEISYESECYLRDCIGTESIILGYELSEQTRKVLDNIGIVYIDIWLHPIRYMDDVLFAMYSNNICINEKLKNQNLNNNYYKIYASRLKVQSYKGFKRSLFHLDENSALFIGQTLNDKAVLSNGKMLNLLDFKNEFSELCKKHKTVYYSRHPFVKSGDEDVLKFINSFKNVELIDKPSYELITRDEIKSVMTISSSVAIESYYFGKEIDYLYKPAVNILNGGYYSIYNKFCSTKFWSEILSDFFDVTDVDVNFLDSKDKLRDTLSFYWSYRHIDKLESLKITVGNLYNKKNNINLNNNMKNIYDEFLFNINLDSVSVISFDIFDTLICRKTSSPRDIFRIIEKNALKFFNTKLSGFSNLRIQCEDNTRKEVLDETGRQDISIDEIYSKIEYLSGLDGSLIEKIKKKEIELELSFIEQRNIGIELFHRALRSGKKVILTSDMYLDRDNIEDILNSNDIYGFSNLYLSSDVGLRKHEGDLFFHLMKDLGIKPDNLFHIGDNINGDVRTPNKIGIKTLHLKRSVDVLKSSNPRVANVLVNKKGMSNIQQNIVNGLYANRFYDLPDKHNYKGSHFNGDSYELGYIGLGPFIASFCSQINKICKEKGIEELIFLSRDGRVIKQAFDSLYPDDRIVTNYMYCSRRSTQVASIKSRLDILNILRKPVFSTTIYKYLNKRFGLRFDQIKISSLINNGLKTKLDNIGGKFDKNSLENIVMEHLDEILNNADLERKDYLKYYNSNRKTSSDKIAIVDIGYSCSMQSFFEEFVSENIFGFYVSTFNTAFNNVNTNNTYSFISNLHNELKPIHGINTHRFIYENLFCSSEDSFLKMDGEQPIFSDENDPIRKAMVDIVHNGVVDFCSDIKSTIKYTDGGVLLDPFISTSLMLDFIKFPNKIDVSLFSGIKFEDGFASEVPRYIIPKENDINDKKIVDNSIWKEGVLRFCQKNVTNKKSDGKGNVKKITNTTSGSNVININEAKDKKEKNIMPTPKKISTAVYLMRNDRSKFNKKLKKYFKRVF